MGKVTTKIITSKKVWENFVLKNSPYSFLQSWNWGEAHVKLNEEIIRLGVYEGKKVVGVALLIHQNAKRGPHFIIPGGPLIEWDNKKIRDVLLSAIKKLAKEKQVWFVRIRPEIVDSRENRNMFRNLGFMRAPMHLHAEHTWILDISESEEDILKGMRKNTRYMVRKSLESGLNVKVSTNRKDIALLYQLQKETAKRHKFVGFSEKLFKAQLETFANDDQIKLFIVSKDKEPLVAALIIFYGNYAYYHHSASSKKARDIPASYLLQWSVIGEAKKRNLKGYNFWGIAPEGVKNHRFSGVTTFKTGFGGERIDWLPAQDLPISPLYWATFIFEHTRRRLRKL